MQQCVLNTSEATVGKIVGENLLRPSDALNTTIPYDLTWAQTRAAMVGSQRLSASVMAQPQMKPSILLKRESLQSPGTYINGPGGNLLNHTGVSKPCIVS
jgi:hypothetical protein